MFQSRILLYFAPSHYGVEHGIPFNMFDGLIEGSLARAVADTAPECEVTELRLRVNRPLVVCTARERRVAAGAFGSGFIVGAGDVERIMQLASDFSVYSVNEDMIKGFIPKKNVRIGVAGEGVVENGKLITVKNICALTIRIPHQIKNAADSVIAAVLGNGLKNTIVISPPSGGKTTLLRELARHASGRYNTLIIDERYEIACCQDGAPRLDVGDCDVMSGIAKSAAYESCIRAMNPDLIVTDEIFRTSEVDSVRDIVRSGVGVFASVHGKDADGVRASAVFAPLFDVFDIAVVLSKRNGVGTIEEVARL